MNRYERMAEQYRPSPVKLLLIGESPPFTEAADMAQVPYFYNARWVCNQRDALLRETAKVILGRHVCIDSEPTKHGVLSELKEKGVFLIDAVEQPFKKGLGRRQRRAAIDDGIPRLLSRIKQLNPRQIIIVLTRVYDIIYDRLETEGLRPVPVRVPSPWAAKRDGLGYKDKLREALLYKRSQGHAAALHQRSL
jgi:hypothetical protein